MHRSGLRWRDHHHLLSPVLGAIADRGGYRKLFLFLSTWIAIVGCVGLYFMVPGDQTQAVKALCIVVVANVAFEVGGVFYNAFLPNLAPPD